MSKINSKFNRNTKNHQVFRSSSGQKRGYFQTDIPGFAVLQILNYKLLKPS